jgi:putative phage-type endonuclease
MEQRSQQWHEARIGLVTASSVGAILGLDPHRDSNDVLRSMVRTAHGAEPEFTGNVATEYGTFHEAGALNEYMMETGNKVDQVGFLVCPGEPWIGASPDGIVGDFGLLEIKCPYRLRSGEGEHKSIKEQPHYYAQMQVQMYCADAAWCDFYQWAPHSTMLERVPADDEWARKYLPRLKAFYESYLVELSNKAHLQPMRKEIDNAHAAKLLSEYDHTCDQIDYLTTRKKEIIGELVQMAKERDALVCGRKLTKVESAGAVSYAQVVKKYCPDVDLEPFRGKASVSWRLS